MHCIVRELFERGRQSSGRWLGERLSVGCQRASQSLRAALALVPTMYINIEDRVVQALNFLWRLLSARPFLQIHHHPRSLQPPTPTHTQLVSSPSLARFCFWFCFWFCYCWCLHFPQLRISPLAHAVVQPRYNAASSAHPAYLSELSCYAIVTPTCTWVRKYIPSNSNSNSSSNSTTIENREIEANTTLTTPRERPVEILLA